MATLDDVARAAGVSKATVSHVINGTRFVREETANRVRAAITATGFRPNPLARALRTATTETIGFVASDISNPFSSAVIRGVESATRKANHNLLVANSANDPDLEISAIRGLEERRIDGLVVALTTHARDETIDFLAAASVPVVLLDRTVPIAVDQVLVDNEAPVADLVGRLLDAGHRRVGVIASEPDHSSTSERIEGWARAHRARRLPFDPALIAYSDPDAEHAQRVVETVLGASKDAPTALFATNSTMAQGVYRAARRLGRRISDELSVAAFDDFEWADLLEPPLTCLAQPAHRMGQQAVELLFDRVGDPSTPPRVIRLEPELRIRASTPGLA